MWRFVRHIAFDMFARGADQKWSMAGPQPSLRGRRFPSPSLSNACHAGYPRPNLRSGVIIFYFFFCFFASLFLWPEREKITPSFRKQITEIKGEGMIAGYPRLCAYSCAYNISISASTRRTNLSVFLVLILMLMSTQFSLAYTCACAYVYAYAYA